MLLVAVAVGVALRAQWIDAFEPRALVNALKRAGSEAGAVPLFLLLYAVGTSLLLPAVGFGIVAAVVWGYLPGLAVSMVALNAVATGHFFVGRWLGRERVDAFLKRRGWDGVVLRESGVATVIAVRQIPLPFVAVNLAAGASPLKWWHFAVGSAIGALPPGLVYTYFATALIDGVEGARTEAFVKALVGAAGMFTLVVAPKVLRWWRGRQRVTPT